MEERLYYLLGGDGRPYGPARQEVVRQWLRDGRLTPHSQINVVGQPDWQPLANLPEFGADLPPPPAPGVPPGSPVYVVVPRRTHPLAIAGFICGLLSLTCCACCCGQFLGLGGLGMSVAGLVLINRQPERYEGGALAIAGIVLSGVGLVLGWFGTGASVAASLAEGGRGTRIR